MSEKKLISMNQFARRIGVSHPTLSKWIEKGIIAPDIKNPNGRYQFYESSVDEYLRKFSYKEVHND